MELRADRAFQIFCRSIFKGADNLRVLAGDARLILSRHFGAGVVDDVFVNHPEPPQQTKGGVGRGRGGGGGGLENSSEAKHLLDEVGVCG